MLHPNRLVYDVPFIDPPPTPVARLICLGFDYSAAVAACNAPPLNESQTATIHAAFAGSRVNS
jgi:hypothetical protein